MCESHSNECSARSQIITEGILERLLSILRRQELIKFYNMRNNRNRKQNSTMKEPIMSIFVVPLVGTALALGGVTFGTDG